MDNRIIIGLIVLAIIAVGAWLFLGQGGQAPSPGPVEEEQAREEEPQVTPPAEEPVQQEQQAPPPQEQQLLPQEEQQVQEPAMKTFTLEADDNGFYPTNVLTVNRGDTVRLTFQVRTANVYFGGLDFRSPHFSTEPVSPGGSVTVEFAPTETFEFTSWWPDSQELKSTGRVDVQ